MENQQSPPASSPLDNFFNLVFDETTRTQIRTAAQWARISALCAFIGYGVALIVAIFGQQGELVQGEGFRFGGVSRVGNVLGTLIAAGIGVFINYFLYRFATAAAQGMNAMDSVRTNEGFNNLRIYFRVLGIIIIILLSLMVLIFLFAIISIGMARG
jgi:hypothetical protein